MTKLLYIPNGEYVKFFRIVRTTSPLSNYTSSWEDSAWYKAYSGSYSLERVILEICESGPSLFKEYNGFDIKYRLVPEEFEIIYD